MHVDVIPFPNFALDLTFFALHFAFPIFDLDFAFATSISWFQTLTFALCNSQSDMCFMMTCLHFADFLPHDADVGILLWTCHVDILTLHMLSWVLNCTIAMRMLHYMTFTLTSWSCNLGHIQLHFAHEIRYADFAFCTSCCTCDVWSHFSHCTCCTPSMSDRYVQIALCHLDWLDVIELSSSFCLHWHCWSCGHLPSEGLTFLTPPLDHLDCHSLIWDISIWRFAFKIGGWIHWGAYPFAMNLSCSMATHGHLMDYLVLCHSWSHCLC